MNSLTIRYHSSYWDSIKFSIIIFLFFVSLIQIFVHIETARDLSDPVSEALSQKTIANFYSFNSNSQNLEICQIESIFIISTWNCQNHDVLVDVHSFLSLSRSYRKINQESEISFTIVLTSTMICRLLSFLLLSTLRKDHQMSASWTHYS